MIQLFRKFAWLLIITQVISLPMARAGDEENRKALRVELEQLAQRGALSNSKVKIASVKLLTEIYQRRDFLPAWNDQKQVGELVTAIKATAADGLDPSETP